MNTSSKPYLLSSDKEFKIEQNDKEKGYSCIVWDVRDIWECVESTQMQLIPTIVFNSLLESVVTQFTQEDFVRAEMSDITYPIIITRGLSVIDGLHRLYKVVNQGEQLIAVKFIESMPLAYSVEGDPFNDFPMLDIVWKTKFE